MIWSFLLSSLAVAAPSVSEVERLFHGAENWMPSDANRANDKVRGWGVEAVPAITQVLQNTTNTSEQYHICDALGKIPDRRSAQAILNPLRSESWTTRSSCGEAYALIALAFPSVDATPAVELIRSDPECPVRINVARELGSRNRLIQSELETMLHGGNPCDVRVGISGLGGLPEGRHWATFYGLMTSSSVAQLVRDKATHAFTRHEYPQAAPYLRALSSEELPNPGGNMRTFAIRAMGLHGTSDDLPMLRQVIANDPHGGQSTWAHSARSAIKAIKARF